MDTITKLVGARIRGFRKEKRLSQEELAEKCSLHPTYIGQLERGEKNPTIESVMKVADGLEIPIDQLFINIPCSNRQAMDYIPDRIMYLVAEMSPKEQRIIYDLIIQARTLRSSKNGGHALPHLIAKKAAGEFRATPRETPAASLFI